MFTQRHTERPIERLRGIAVVLLALCLTTPAKAESVGKMMKLAGFRNLILTIAMVNRAMADASKNPQDDFRRRNVQTAMGLMPVAIFGLAAEFRSGKLHDKDLPMVQKLLAGYVDVNAGTRFSSFMKKPDASLIPALPGNFPQVEAPPVPQSSSSSYASSGQGSGGRAVVDEGAASNAALAEVAGKSSSKEIVSLSASREDISNLRTERASAAAATPSRAVVDEAAPESASAAIVEAASSLGSPEALSSSALPNASSASRPAASADNSPLGSSRSASNSEGTSRAPASFVAPKKKSGLDEADSEILHSVGRDKKVLEKKSDRRSQSAPSHSFAQRYPLGLSLWLAAAKSVFGASSAHAEECGNGECSKGGGGGEGGGGGGQGGMAAAAIISAIGQSISDVMKAMAPVQVAKIQAKTDLAISENNNKTQLALLNKQSETTLEVTGIQASSQASANATQERMQKAAQDAVTERLDTQLDKLEVAAERAQAFQEKVFAKENELTALRFEEQKEVNRKNAEIAQAQIDAARTAAGTQSGFTDSIDSGSQLGSSSTALLASNSSAGSTVGDAASSVASRSASVGSSSPAAASLGLRDVRSASSDTASATGLPGVALASSGGTAAAGAAKEDPLSLYKLGGDSDEEEIASARGSRRTAALKRKNAKGKKKSSGPVLRMLASKEQPKAVDGKVSKKEALAAALTSQVSVPAKPVSKP